MTDRLSRWRKSSRIARDLEAIGLLAVIAIASALLLLPRGDDGLIGLPDLRAGEVAPRTVKSPRAFSVIDPVLTAQMRERARAAVRPVFDHLLGLASVPKGRLEAAFAAVEGVEGREARARAFVEALGIDVEPSMVGPIVASDQPSVVLDAASMLLEGLFARQLVSDPSLFAAKPEITVRAVDADGRVVSEKELAGDAFEEVLGPNQARALVDALAAERLEHLDPRVSRAIARVVKDLLTPNLVRNAQETLRRRRRAWMGVKPSMVVVARGDRVIRGGEQVTERDLLLLNALADLESPSARLQSMIGSALLGGLLAWLAYRSARYAYRHRLPKKRDLAFLASSFIAYLLLVWLGYKVVDWLAEVGPVAGLSPEGYRLGLPLAAIAIVVRTAAGPIAAAAAAPVFGLLAGWMMDGDLDFAAYALAGALAAASTEPGAKRTVLAAGARAGLAQALTILGTALLASSLELREVGLHVAVALASGLTAAALARTVVPAVEALFGYTTPTGLAAFADAEHPLLRELLVEVPGTYHHSLHVGTLAEAGARAIGSDRLLARVGGYFHDVGRLGGRREPEGRRKAAAKLAAQHRFPPELAQILAEQPHEAGRGGEAGPRRAAPRSKTSALVVLADRVEDALRGREGEIEDRAALERIVHEEIRSAVADRLLDEAALELRELAAVSSAFTDALEPRFVGRGSGGASGLRVAGPLQDRAGGPEDRVQVRSALRGAPS